MMTPRSGPPSSVTTGSVAAIAAAARRITLNVPTRLNLDDPAERLQREHAVAAQHLAWGGDAGAVHHDPQGAEGDGGVNRAPAPALRW